MLDPYKILGVTRSASLDEIRAAFRALALKYHPDRNQGNKEAEARFKELSQAYDILSNPDKRKTYDRNGNVGEPDDDLLSAFRKAFGGGDEDDDDSNRSVFGKPKGRR